MHHWGVERGFLEEASERGFEGCIGFQQIVMGRSCPRKHREAISMSKSMAAEVGSSRVSLEGRVSLEDQA